MPGQLVTLDQSTQGYAAKPTGAGPRPGVVVVHEVHGLNDYVKQVVEEVAEHGFVALAVDLYEGKVAQSVEEGMPLREKVTEDVLRSKVGAGIQHLKSQSDCTGQLGVVGFCMGGGFALWSACLFPDDIKACSVFYGRIGNLDLLERLKHPVIGNFGAQDAGITTWAGAELWPAMVKLEKSLDMKVYPGAPHGFARRGDPRSYRQEAGDDAWRRTYDLFTRELERS